MRTSRPGQAGGRYTSILLVALLVASTLVLFAAPALAVSLNVNPKSGPPGTRVTVAATAANDPCEVFFDGTRIIDAGTCRPGENVSTVFTIPANATSGAHQFRAVEGASQVSVTFTVGTAAPPPPPPPPPGPPAPPPAPPPPPPAPRPPAPAPRPPAAAPQPPPTPPAPAAPTPTSTPGASPEPIVSPGPSPTAAQGCLQPRSVESMSIAPASGEPGTTASVVINWAPAALTDCAGAESQIRVNGEPSSDPIPVADQTRVEVDIPEDVSGDIPITLVSLGSDARVLFSSQFTVEGGDTDDGVSAWLVVAALLIATMAALGAQRLYSRRRALYGRR